MKVPVKDRYFVFLQGVLMISWLIEPDSLKLRLPENLRWIALFCGLFGAFLILLALLQLKKRISPFPTPKKNTALETAGVFAFCRHPIYSGLLFAAFGLAVWWNSGYKLLIGGLLLLFFYIKSNYEEHQLEQRFPQYSAYRKETGRFFPKFNWRI